MPGAGSLGIPWPGGLGRGTIRRANRHCMGFPIFMSVPDAAVRVAGGRMSLPLPSVVQHLLRDRVRITAVALAVLRNAHDADDVFQQVMLAAVEGKDVFREPEHLRAWALRAARHRAIDQARTRHLEVLDAGALDALEAHWATAPADNGSARADALDRCLGALPARHRELLRLRYEGGLDGAELARRLGRSTEAVYQTLSRLHRRLKECVEYHLGRRAPSEAVP